ncbi:MAG: hypothetical protein AAF481_16055 [Acidobacteriota bacterium]
MSVLKAPVDCRMPQTSNASRATVETASPRGSALLSVLLVISLAGMAPALAQEAGCPTNVPATVIQSLENAEIRAQAGQAPNWAQIGGDYQRALRLVQAQIREHESKLRQYEAGIAQGNGAQWRKAASLTRDGLKLNRAAAQVLACHARRSHGGATGAPGSRSSQETLFGETVRPVGREPRSRGWGPRRSQTDDLPRADLGEAFDTALDELLEGLLDWENDPGEETESGANSGPETGCKAQVTARLKTDNTGQVFLDVRASSDEPSANVSFQLSNPGLTERPFGDPVFLETTEGFAELSIPLAHARRDAATESSPCSNLEEASRQLRENWTRLSTKYDVLDTYLSEVSRYREEFSETETWVAVGYIALAFKQVAETLEVYLMGSSLSTCVGGLANATISEIVSPASCLAGGNCLYDFLNKHASLWLEAASCTGSQIAATISGIKGRLDFVISTAENYSHLQDINEFRDIVRGNMLRLEGELRKGDAKLKQLANSRREVEEAIQALHSSCRSSALEGIAVKVLSCQVKLPEPLG